MYQAETVFAATEEKRRILELAGDFSQDVYRLSLELVEIVSLSAHLPFHNRSSITLHMLCYKLINP